MLPAWWDISSRTTRAGGHPELLCHAVCAGWLEKLLQIGTGVYETAIYSIVGDVGSIETTVSALGYMGSAMVTLGIAAAFGVFWFGLTVWLMRNKLNLE